MRRAYRRPSLPQDMEWVQGFYQEGRREGHLPGRHRVGAAPHSDQSAVSGARRKRAANVRARPALPHHRSGTGFAPVVPDLEQHPGRRTDRCRQPEQAAYSRPFWSSRCGACWPIPRPTRWWRTSAISFCICGICPPPRRTACSIPNWDDELRKSFRRETELLFESIIKENRNVVDLLTADYTFLNERLAKHYGIPNIYGSEFRRVTLGPDLAYRRGLLGQGSVSRSPGSQNFRTSPVKRGVWVLENILGTPPPEPPPNVPPLEDTKGDGTRS